MNNDREADEIADAIASEWREERRELLVSVLCEVASKELHQLDATRYMTIKRHLERVLIPWADAAAFEMWQSIQEQGPDI